MVSSTVPGACGSDGGPTVTTCPNSNSNLKSPALESQPLSTITSGTTLAGTTETSLGATNKPVAGTTEGPGPPGLTASAAAARRTAAHVGGLPTRGPTLFESESPANQHALASQAFSLLGNWVEARKSAEAALALDPSNAEASSALGRAHEGLG